MKPTNNKFCYLSFFANAQNLGIYKFDFNGRDYKINVLNAGEFIKYHIRINADYSQLPSRFLSNIRFSNKETSKAAFFAGEKPKIIISDVQLRSEDTTNESYQLGRAATPVPLYRTEKFCGSEDLLSQLKGPKK